MDSASEPAAALQWGSIERVSMPRVPEISEIPWASEAVQVQPDTLMVPSPRQAGRSSGPTALSSPLGVVSWTESGLLQSPTSPGPTSTVSRRISGFLLGSTRITGFGRQSQQLPSLEKFEFEGDLLNRLSTRGSITISDKVENLVLEHQFGGSVDWKKQHNKDRLRDMCKLTRNLFWAFTEKDSHTEEVVPVTFARRLLHRLVHSEAFTAFFIILTIYALLGTDFAMMLGHIPHNPDNQTLAILNTFVLCLFIFEVLCYCSTVRGYPFSGRFWIDAFATFTLIGDTMLWTEIIQSDAAVAGKGSRLIRFVRMGGRSSRLLRFMRVARAAQAVRLIPKLQAWLEYSTKTMATLLWKKRLKRIFDCLDKSGCGVLSEIDLAFFYTTMFIEFPETPDEQLETTKSRWLPPKLAARAASIRNTFGKSTEWNRSQDLGNRGSFESLMHEFYHETRTGKRSYMRCLEDIRGMRGSCEMVDKVISRLTLKVCLLVLALLILTQLIQEGSTEPDTSMSQGIRLLDVLAQDSEVTRVVTCLIVNRYCNLVNSPVLLLLILDRRLYYNETHDCTQAQATGETLYADPVHIADNVAKATGLEAHELGRVDAADGDSVAVFDDRKYWRGQALFNVIHTSMVVFLLMGLIMYFVNDIKALSNHNILHPLWDLIDDMCAMKSIEVLAARVDQTEDMHEPVPGVYHQISLWTPAESKVRRCSCGQPIAVADELLQLRKSFQKLQMTMLAWAKYVPVSLLTQLFEAEVEARIGCAFAEVSVVFCDISHFKERVKGNNPRAVLHLLDMVLGKIYEALDENGGTLLEFIGDEMLAIFNAPLKVDDHARCAVRAALEAQVKVRELPIRHAVRLQSSVHTARVLVGNIGSPTRMKYGVLGDGVNVSARLKSLNSRYGTQLLVSGDVLSLHGVEDHFITRPVGNLVLKGRTTPTPTHEVLAPFSSAPGAVVLGAEKHREAFQYFTKRRFAEAMELFKEAHDLLAGHDEGDGGDGPSDYLYRLAEGYLLKPPPEDWDASEYLQKKTW